MNLEDEAVFSIKGLCVWVTPGYHFHAEAQTARGSKS